MGRRPGAAGRGSETSGRLDLARIGDCVLDPAGSMPPADLGSLAAIQLASAAMLRGDLAAAAASGIRLVRPG